MKKNYTPNPVDTSDVIIPRDLLTLSEQLAKNTHECWAAARIRDGWTYGKVRNDIEKMHPDLIPYEDLPEIEKEYDRITSSETIKLILKLGYSIQAPEEHRVIVCEHSKKNGSALVE